MPTEQELRLHRCCFTGHCPEKIDMPERKVIAALEKQILAAIDEGFTTFIFGMARGSDILAAEIVMRLRKKTPSPLDRSQPLRRFRKILGGLLAEAV